MPEINEIKGVGPVLGLACTKSGFGSVKKVAAATEAELATVPGVGEAKAKSLIIAAQLLLGEPASSAATDTKAGKANGAAAGGMKAKEAKEAKEDKNPQADKKKKKKKDKKKDKKEGKSKKKNSKKKNKKKKK